MVVWVEQGDHGKEPEECCLPQRRPWWQSCQKTVELRALRKLKSAGSCVRLDASAKEREASKVTSRRPSGGNGINWMEKLRKITRLAGRRA